MSMDAHLLAAIRRCHMCNQDRPVSVSKGMLRIGPCPNLECRRVPTETILDPEAGSQQARSQVVIDALQDNHGHTLKIQSMPPLPSGLTVEPHLWWIISDTRDSHLGMCEATDHLCMNLDQTKRAVSATVEWIKQHDPDWSPDA